MSDGVCLGLREIRNSEETEMSFADNLIELRKYHDFSQEELAEMIGVSRQTLSKYETGVSHSKSNTIVTL